MIKTMILYKNYALKIYEYSKQIEYKDTEFIQKGLSIYSRVVVNIILVITLILLPFKSTP